LQEVEQAAERVSIGTDRLRAGGFLLDEVLREERAEERAERNDRVHDPTLLSAYFSNRAAAGSSTCGATVRYQ
jgi:hypothetical protein